MSGLLEFCSTVGNLIPSSPAGQKDKELTLDIAKMIPFEQLLKILSEGCLLSTTIIAAMTR